MSALRPILLWLLASTVLVALVALAGTFVADAVPVASPYAGDASATGAVAAAGFRLPTLDGGRLGPPDLAGQVVVVELWATWCGPCKIQARYLEELVQEYGQDGPVAFLAVNVGEDEAKVRGYVAENPMSYPVLLDREQSLFARYGLSALPTVMVVDPGGEIVFMQSSVVDARTLRAEIEEALG